MCNTKTKVCSKCGVVKPLTNEFFNVRKDSKDGYRNDCKLCKTLYDNQRYVKNEDKVKEKSNKQYHNNKKSIKIKKQEYYKKNKSLFKNKSKVNYIENRELRLEKQKKYRENNSKIIDVWKNNNKDKIRLYGREYRKKRMSNDELYKLKIQVGKMVLSTFSRKNWTKRNKTSSIIGCDYKTFKQHIESLFLPGMTWDNHGSGRGFWHYDHHIPISSAKDVNDIYRLNHFKNIKPMWEEDNLKKSDKISVEWGNLI